MLHRDTWIAEYYRTTQVERLLHESRSLLQTHEVKERERERDGTYEKQACAKRAVLTVMIAICDLQVSGVNVHVNKPVGPTEV